MKKTIYLYLFFMLTGAVFLIGAGSDSTDTAVDTVGTERSSTVYTLALDGPIGTVTADRIIDAIQLCEEEDADLLLITMDTPGGFNESMWAITRAIMNSTVPVAVYIYPVGARAASAGLYITYAAHVAAMAPSTNIGAAHVVAGGGQQVDSVMMEKVMNDAVAALKGMAERHSRNAEWAEKAARESVSITATEALELGVIDFMADNIEELLAKIDGHEVEMVYGRQAINTANPTQTPISKTWIQSILEVISSPTIAFILFSIGGLGLVIELYNPGAILPGVVGGICLILAFYSFRTLPVNYAGLLLIVFAIILFILEVKVVSYGLLSIGGVISFIFGGLMLIDTNDPSMQISRTVIVMVAIFVLAFIIFAGYFVVKARRSKPTTGVEGLVGQVGRAKTRVDKRGMVYVAGEYWEAISKDIIEEGEEVVVESVDGLKIHVKKKS